MTEVERQQAVLDWLEAKARELRTVAKQERRRRQHRSAKTLKEYASIVESWIGQERGTPEATRGSEDPERIRQAQERLARWEALVRS